MDTQDDELRAKVPTAEGVHLREPDAFPHVMMARLAAIAVGLVLLISITWILAGIVAAIVAAAALLVVIVPILVSRMNRKVQDQRKREIEEERRVEEAEHTAEAEHRAPA